MLLSVKELAKQLGRSERYVWWMRARGFEMPGGKATLTEAREWLSDHPQPSKRRVTVCA